MDNWNMDQDLLDLLMLNHFFRIFDTVFVQEMLLIVEAFML